MSSSDLENFPGNADPSKIFIYSGSGNYSYSASYSEIKKYSTYIVKKIPKGSYCGIAGSNSPHFIFLIISMWKAGVVPLLINIRLTHEEKKNIMLSAGCKYFFHEQGCQIPGMDILSIQFPFSDEAADLPIRNYDENDIAAVIFTSGSTGKPKGVEISFKTLWESAVLQDKFLRHEKGNKWLASLPFYHIGGLSIISRCIFNRCTIVIPDSLKSDNILSAAEIFEIQYISVVGTQLKTMLVKNYSYGRRIKNILLGGGFTDSKIIDDALSRGWKISRVYGSTETSSFIAAVDHEELKKYPDSTAKELVPGSIVIFDKDRKEVEPGSEGEIVLRNIPLFARYLNDPERTSEKFYGGYFLTGDIGYLNEEKYLFVTMRRTDLIVSGGENIDPREVENALLKNDAVDDAYVFPVPDLKWGQLCAAAVAVSSDITENEIKNLLSLHLAGFKIPKKIYFLNEIPRNALGKVMQSEVLSRLKID